MNSILETFRRQGMQVRAETPEERASGESLLATVRAAAAPGLWRPPGAAAPPMTATPPVTPPSPAPAAASRPAPLSPQAVPAPASTRQSAAEMWSQVAAELNARTGLNAGGPQQAESGRLSFIEPRAGQSAGPLWDEVAEKLNAQGRAGATPEASSAAGSQPADIWGAVAASVNAEGRAANAAFIIPGQPHSARSARPRIS